MRNYITKLSVIGVLLLAFASLGAAQQPNPTKQFYDGVNDNWKNQNYAQVLTLINNRLQANPNDVLALSLKSYYYVFAVKDITQAHQAANAFVAVVNAGTTKQNLKDQALVMKKRVTDIPTTDTTPFTQAERDAMHVEVEKFPFIDESLVFWGKFTEQL